MRGNRPSATQPELRLRRALWAQGIRGYRLNVPNLPGRPDIAFRRHGLAVFVHGCFWHRCPKHHPNLPQAHQAYWRSKFELNAQRDREKVRQLRSLGWTVVTVWECEVNQDPSGTAERVSSELALRQFRTDRRAYLGRVA